MRVRRVDHPGPDSAGFTSRGSPSYLLEGFLTEVNMDQMPVLYRCEPLSASITREQCERNRVRGKKSKFTSDLIIFACEGCGGLGLDEVKIDLEGIEMSKPVRGSCPTCKRENVLLTHTGAECHRCYRRRREGRDLLADNMSPGKKSSKAPVEVEQVTPDTLTGLADMGDRMSEKLKALESADVSDGARAVSDIAPDGGFVVEPVRAEQINGEFCEACGAYPCFCFDGENHVADFGMVTNADDDKVSFRTDLVVLMALDEAWAAKRDEWLVDLSGLSPIKTLGRALMMVDAIKMVGY